MIRIYFSKAIFPKKYSKLFTLDILSKELGICKDKISISKDKYGKPFLKDFPYLHFNISHSKDAIVCGVSDNPIGVDIEKIRTLNTRIIEKYFKPKEKAYIYYRPEMQNERFIEIWTKKEAYAKGLGKGMKIPFNSFDVLGDKRIKTEYIDNQVLSIFSENIKNVKDINIVNWKIIKSLSFFVQI